jgi:hypothetical protein
MATPKLVSHYQSMTGPDKRRMTGAEPLLVLQSLLFVQPSPLLRLSACVLVYLLCDAE